jgi:hypothetical protein
MWGKSGASDDSSFCLVKYNHLHQNFLLILLASFHVVFYNLSKLQRNLNTLCSTHITHIYKEFVYNKRNIRRTP